MREISDGTIYKGDGEEKYKLMGGYVSGKKDDVISVSLSTMGNVLGGMKDIFTEWGDEDYGSIADNLGKTANELFNSFGNDAKLVSEGLQASYERGQRFYQNAMKLAENEVAKEELVKDIVIAYLTGGGSAGVKQMIKDKIRDALIDKAAEATGMDPTLIRLALGKFEQAKVTKRMNTNATNVINVVGGPIAGPLTNMGLKAVGIQPSKIITQVMNNPLTQAYIQLGSTFTGGLSNQLIQKMDFYQNNNKLNELKQQEKSLIQNAVSSTVASAIGLPPEASGYLSQYLGGVMKRKEQKRNNARLDHVVSSGLGTGVSMVNGIVNGITRNAIVAFGGSGKVYDQFMTTPFTPEATWSGAEKIDKSKEGLMNRAQEYAFEQALIANGMDAELAKTVASTTNGKIKAKKAKKEERTKAIESTAQTAIAVAGMVVAPGSTAGMLLNLASTALSTAIGSRTGGAQGAAAGFMNGVLNTVMPGIEPKPMVALNITYDKQNGWGGGIGIGGNSGNASLQLSQRGGAQVTVGTKFGSVNYDSGKGTVGVNANLTGFLPEDTLKMIKAAGLQGLGASIGWNSATGASASVSYNVTGANNQNIGGLGLNFNNQGSNITGTTQGTNLFTSSSDGSFSINTNFANDRLTNLAVDQAQDAFDEEMADRITEAENKAIKKAAEKNGDDIDPTKLTGKAREDALKAIGWGMGDENEAKDTSNRNKIWGEFTDGLNNLATAIGVGGLQATGASGFVDADGKFHPRTCFTAGTKIHKLKDSVVASEANLELLEVNAGLEELVNIENVKAGNFVRSWNEKTGKMGYKKVLNTFERVAEGIYNLELSNGEVIQPTWNHPFWVLSTSPNLSGVGLSSTTSPLLRGKGTGDYPLSLAGKWVETKDLKVGDRLLAANGDIITVEDVSYDAGQVKVYNFEVEDNHTYFVGELGVLVHNTEGCFVFQMPNIQGGFDLRHAAIATIDANGNLNYSEFGRYDEHRQGIVKSLAGIPKQILLDNDGKPVDKSVENLLRKIANLKGDKSIEAYYINLTPDERKNIDSFISQSKTGSIKVLKDKDGKINIEYGNTATELYKKYNGQYSVPFNNCSNYVCDAFNSRTPGGLGISQPIPALQVYPFNDYYKLDLNKKDKVQFETNKNPVRIFAPFTINPREKLNEASK